MLFPSFPSVAPNEELVCFKQLAQQLPQGGPAVEKKAVNICVCRYLHRC